MNDTYKKYKIIESNQIDYWSKKYYANWLLSMQNQENTPNNDIEKFFRWYSQGIHYFYNSCLRYDRNIAELFKDSPLGSPEIFNKVIQEMNENSIKENIVVFRYIDKKLLQNMLNWSNCKTVRKNKIIWDKGFLSTTLTPKELLGYHEYATRKNTLLKIYVPEGTPCVFLELISAMKENEILFPPNTKMRIVKRDFIKKNIECLILNN